MLLGTAPSTLLYTALNSPGYYADRGERVPVTMFTVFVLLGVLALAGVLLL